MRREHFIERRHCPVLSRWILYTACLVLVSMALPQQGVYAQLISPGKLMRAHAALEGMNNCTQCHTPGTRSSDNTLCRDCHTPISNRIEANTGLHAPVGEQNCATCHKDHFGVEFIAVRFDTLTFEHEDTGFELTGAHTETSCRGCHQPSYIDAEDVLAFKGEHDALEKTFLGASTTCIGCHVSDSPHETQFPEVQCNTCHDTQVWEEVPFFDHDDARFALTGKHIDVECESCHTTLDSPHGEPYVQYVDMDFATCASCHEDTHEGAFGADCASCHRTEGWHQIANLANMDFDHTSTGYPLVGSHNTLECNTCHGKPARNDDLIALVFTPASLRNAYPVIPVENCTSCHVDYHEGVFEASWSDGSCEQCHGEDAWYPSSFDVVLHNERSTYELTGAHIATPCSGCHRPDFEEKPHFEIAETTCVTCHQDDDPHGNQFIADGMETTCESCHEIEDWRDPSLFDHGDTEFPLTGVHQATECSACHVADASIGSPFDIVRYRDTHSTCISCHEPDNPHGDQFDTQTCNSCHGTSSFYIAAFDHDDTAFPLTGEHVEVPCSACHLNEAPLNETPFIRFKPLGTACQDCHSNE